MSPNDWGPPTWNLFHTLADTVKEDKYPTISAQLYGFINQISYEREGYKAYTILKSSLNN